MDLAPHAAPGDAASVPLAVSAAGRARPGPLVGRGRPCASYVAASLAVCFPHFNGFRQPASVQIVSKTRQIGPSRPGRWPRAEQVESLGPGNTPRRATKPGLHDTAGGARARDQRPDVAARLSRRCSAGSACLTLGGVGASLDKGGRFGQWVFFRSPSSCDEDPRPSHSTCLPRWSSR